MGDSGGFKTKILLCILPPTYQVVINGYIVGYGLVVCRGFALLVWEMYNGRSESKSGFGELK